jgi:hypothetical protein
VALFQIQSRIEHCQSIDQLIAKSGQLVKHFLQQGTPAMVGMCVLHQYGMLLRRDFDPVALVFAGGGTRAYTILGACYRSDSEEDVQFLILDPHYSGYAQCVCLVCLQARSDYRCV